MELSRATQRIEEIHESYGGRLVSLSKQTFSTVGDVVQIQMAKDQLIRGLVKELKQVSQRKTTTADIPVFYKSNRNRHHRAILTDKTGKKAHLDDRRLIFKMARSILHTGHDSGYQRKDILKTQHFLTSVGVPLTQAETPPINKGETKLKSDWLERYRTEKAEVMKSRCVRKI
ncbi:hypothetical protein T09_8255 [Trichinella sp. T9]|nr:hypothetical protein T09_8255 [Trichinella sp. T9]